MRKYRFFLIPIVALVFQEGLWGQTLQLRERIGKSYKEENIEALYRFYNKRYKVFMKGFVDENGRIPVDVDSLGTAFYYKNYNELSAYTAAVTDALGVQRFELYGTDMIIGIWDSALPRYDHKDLEGKIEVTDGSTLGDYGQHATHVAGTLVSAGRVSREGRGLALNAKLWANDWTDDFNEMLELAQKGLLVSNHSYGIDPEEVPAHYFGAYISSSQRLDALAAVFDYYQPVVAAGNDRKEFESYNPEKNGSDLLLGMATSKNAVVVAALDGNTKENLKMTDFSSWGPTDDLRVKPDIGARGQKVWSTLEKEVTAYGFLSGTSMAAPVVSAVVALWQEWAMRYLGMPLKAATIRGLLIHTAYPVQNQQGPNAENGWGAVDFSEGVDFLNKALEERGAHYVEETLFQNQRVVYSGKVTKNQEKLVATLSWTDSEGELKFGTEDDRTPDLVNDLDLRIKVKGETYYPWKLKKDAGSITAEKGDNLVDNIEKIEVDVLGMEGEEVEVNVMHKGELRKGLQNYSLLISGLDNLENSELKGSRVLVWPNPAKEYIVVHTEGNPIQRIQIFDVQGKNVLNQEVRNTQSVSIDISKLAKGLYFVSIKGVFYNEDTKLVIL